ncbi:spore gernimation protein KA [Paenibacillus pectinilyticus]|uniref:Spore gernimation protein KA n=1 Tax=Paenibacillus pectinilyticus TaxID=512399 RepID=A0A1C0ZU72_9BACL|nr:spore germination protein [Paenibacillus pectinilyticus]OCT11602.1 spore gernimation protein KA [Paenibacillus pectinilyticus]
MKKLLKHKPLSHSAANSETNTIQLLHDNLDESLRTIREELGHSTDLVIRTFMIPSNTLPSKAAIIYINGLANVKDILDSLLIDYRSGVTVLPLLDELPPILLIKEYMLKIGEITGTSDYETLYHMILSGDSVILVDGYPEGICASTRDWKDRGVTEPSSQTVVRGPREGFSETLRTSTALIRRKIKDSHLWMETRQIGRVTKTDVALMFIKGLVDDAIVDEVRTRLSRIDIDGILESGYIEELIQDETYTPFPTIFNTERPDVVAAALLEGRVAILIDGTPFVLLVPAVFTHFFQTAEDYYQRADISSLLRILRYVSLFIALLGPAVYIAVTTFHQEMIPTTLLINIAAHREGIPFPAFVEAMLMEVTFEILREAGIRMPRTIGQAVSIVGALVIGQAAVEAGLVGPAMVIVVAITAISTFIIPSYNMGISIRMIRFALMILAASLGLYGILIGIITLVLHLSSLRSFGVPYLAPFAPFIKEDQGDNIIRLPHWALLKRPHFISTTNRKKQQYHPPRKPES